MSEGSEYNVNLKHPKPINYSVSKLSIINSSQGYDDDSSENNNEHSPPYVTGSRVNANSFNTTSRQVYADRFVDLNLVDRQIKVHFLDNEVILDSINYKHSFLLKCQIGLSFCCLLNVGMADQTTGILLPSLMDYYHVDNSIVSYIFLVQFLGFLLAATTNDFLHKTFGVRGTILSAQLACIICFGVCSLKPPFAFLIIIYLLNGFSTGCQNSTFNSWAGKLNYNNQILGLLHAAYGIGSILTPVFGAFVLKHSNGNWNEWYFILVLNASLLFISCYFGFKNENNIKHLFLLQNKPNRQRQPFKESQTNYEKFTFFKILQNKTIWFFSIPLFLIIGNEVSMGNWLYNYLMVIHNISTTASSFITSSFWLCLTVGRVVLGFIIGHFFEKKEIKVLYYLCISISLFTFLFAIIPIVTIKCMNAFVVGFFVGPVFATTAIAAMQVLPLELHISGVTFITSMGGSGSGVVPYLVGLLSSLNGEEDAKGLKLFPWISFVNFALATCIFTYFYQHYYHRDKHTTDRDNELEMDDDINYETL
ncbi:hypothetical protein PACTADRAFT_49119 [Pachysolen tannophilus NRRL Y-2460]|uniref:Major facilitator superfamily (MFS) profile domain-containing protein n=1 Tax=Pachysolen tannophilus NRRL Y-2460 TaxID=669874 RepID=A0A1E4U083_PACTA|nr:hypothetical protein PACTADRAFT_49119 [Pachysolen tannophilus NRRL Y-2460]